MKLNPEDIDRIDLLSDKIRKNLANLSDYEEYEKLLILGGYEKDFIIQKLKDANIESYKELIDKRTKIENELKKYNEDALKERKIVEGIAIVGLVALGLALLFSLAKKK